MLEPVARAVVNQDERSTANLRDGSAISIELIAPGKFLGFFGRHRLDRGWRYSDCGNNVLIETV